MDKVQFKILRANLQAMNQPLSNQAKVLEWLAPHVAKMQVKLIHKATKKLKLIHALSIKNEFEINWTDTYKKEGITLQSGTSIGFCDRSLNRC